MYIKHDLKKGVNLKISRIKINNYKSIKELDLELKDINILIGSNGAGKSNFISFFDFLTHEVEKNLELYVAKQGGADNLLFFGKKKSSYISTYVQFHRNDFFLRLVPTNDDRLIPAEVRLKHKSETNSTKDVKKDFNSNTRNIIEDIDILKEKKETYYYIEAIQYWQVYHFHDTSDSAKVKLTCNINDNRFNGKL